MYQQLTPYFGLILGLLPALFAWLAVNVAGFCRSDGLNVTWWGKLINTGIALFALAVCVLLDLFVSQKLTTNLSTDLQAFEIGFTSLAFGAMKPLMQQIQSVVGFTPQGFVLFPSQQQQSQARVQQQAQAPTLPRIPRVSNAVNAPTSPIIPSNVTSLYPPEDHSG